MLNKINPNNNYKYNISFGLNSTNRNAIKNLRHRTGETAVSIINSFDMKDPDIQPCLDSFFNLIKQDYSNSNEMNAILGKLDVLNINIEENKNGLIKCLHLFFNYWDTFFKSTRINAAKISDKIGMSHPDTGHLSRTVTNPLYTNIATKNIEVANEYIYTTVKENVCPDINFLIELNKIITKDLEYHTKNGSYATEDYAGIIKQSPTDKLKLYSEHIGIGKKLDLFMAWFERNYDKDDTFLFCAQSYKKLLGISPFYDGNGRTIRAFIDAVLYSKGYRFRQYPDNYAEVRNLPMDDLKTLFIDNCEKIP